MGLTATASRPDPQNKADVNAAMPADTAKAVGEVVRDTTAMPDSSLTGRREEARRRAERFAAERATRDSIYESHRDSLRLSARQRERVSLNDDTTARPETGPRISRVKTDLDNVIEIQARDSMVIIGQSRAYLYGESNVKYGDMTLDAAKIEMDLDSSTVYAVGMPDSTGQMEGSPIFEQGGTAYQSKTMRYNFKSEKGIITDVITEQGEGYITGGLSKRVDANTIYMEKGFYTTCDNHEHPHFGFVLTRAKVTPKKNIVTGPAYMVLAGLPLPLAVPFGYFPFSEKYSSGIIVPSFGDDYNRGFYLSGGGYYFAINNNMDLSLDRKSVV